MSRAKLRLLLSPVSLPLSLPTSHALNSLTQLGLYSDRHSQVTFIKHLVAPQAILIVKMLPSMRVCRGLRQGQQVCTSSICQTLSDLLSALGTRSMWNNLQRWREHLQLRCLCVATRFLSEVGLQVGAERPRP